MIVMQISNLFTATYFERYRKKKSKRISAFSVGTSHHPAALSPSKANFFLSLACPHRERKSKWDKPDESRFSSSKPVSFPLCHSRPVQPSQLAFHSATSPVPLSFMVDHSRKNMAVIKPYYYHTHKGRFYGLSHRLHFCSLLLSDSFPSRFFRC